MTLESDDAFTLPNMKNVGGSTFDLLVRRGQVLSEKALKPYKDDLNRNSRLEQAIEKANEEKNKAKHDYLREYSSSYDEFQALGKSVERLKKIHDKLTKRMRTKKTPSRKFVDILLKRIETVESLIEKYQSIFYSKVSSLQAKRKSVIKKAHSLLEEQQVLIKHVMGGLLNHLQSSHSYSASKDWAEQQYISRSAKNLLKTINYSEEAVREDLAQFYRLASGKLDRVSLGYMGCKRASAYLSTKIIYIDDQFSKYSLFHELGHMLEVQDSYRAAAQHFIKKRKQENSEFYDDYVGHTYNDGCTEVFSMGMQQFSTPERLYSLYKSDREMFYMMVGVCD